MGGGRVQSLWRKKGHLIGVKGLALNHPFSRFQHAKSEGINLLFIYRLSNKVWSRTALQNGEKTHGDWFSGCRPEDAGFRWRF